MLIYLCLYRDCHVTGGPLSVFTNVYVNRLVDLNEEDMVTIML